MIKKVTYVGLMAGGLCLAACGNTENERNEASDGLAVNEEMEMLSDEHYAANSLDYFGTYVGVLPCADCPDGEAPVEIVIAADSTFLYTTFETAAGSDPEVLDGKWEIDRNTITFGQAALRFHVAENRLIPIGDDGNRYTGELEEKFSLHKLD